MLFPSVNAFYNEQSTEFQGIVYRVLHAVAIAEFRLFYYPAQPFFEVTHGYFRTTRI